MKAVIRTAVTRGASSAAASLDDLDARLDEALKETFPASDPIAVSESRRELLYSAWRSHPGRQSKR